MTGPVWIASYVLLWVAVLVLAFAVVVLLRQIGVLHARIRPTGVHHAGEGPLRDAPAPDAGWFDWSAAPLTLVVFTSPTCSICASLVPALQRLQRSDRDLRLELVEHAPDTRGLFAAWHVSSTPYVVAVDRTGTVLGGGVANTLEQVEELVETARGGGDRVPRR